MGERTVCENKAVAILDKLMTRKRIPFWNKCYKPFKGTPLEMPQVVQIAQEGIRTRMITSSSSQQCRSRQPPGGALGWFPPLLLARLGEGTGEGWTVFFFSSFLGVFLVFNTGSFGCQSTSRHGTRCCFLAQPYLNHITETQLRTDMLRRQTKTTENTQDSNNALTLFRLQQHVLQLTTAKAALEDIQTLVHETTCPTLPVHKIVEHCTQPSVASIACESGWKPMLTLLSKSNNDNCRSHNGCGKNFQELPPPPPEKKC